MLPPVSLPPSLAASTQKYAAEHQATPLSCWRLRSIICIRWLADDPISAAAECTTTARGRNGTHCACDRTLSIEVSAAQSPILRRAFELLHSTNHRNSLSSVHNPHKAWRASSRHLRRAPQSCESYLQPLMQASRKHSRKRQTCSS